MGKALIIGCGGVAIFPDDVIVADQDGAVVIPQAFVDLILTEGFKQGGKLKIEVYRAELQKPLASLAEELLAIAGDTSLPGVPCYALDDAAGIAGELLRYVEGFQLR